MIINDVHTVEIELIPTTFKLRVYFSDNRDNLDKWIQSIYKTYDKIEDCQVAFTDVLLDKEDTKYIIIVLATSSKDTIVHEINHAIDKLGELIGHSWTIESTEIKSYYLGYIFNIVNNMMNDIERPDIDPFRV